MEIASAAQYTSKNNWLKMLPAIITAVAALVVAICTAIAQAWQIREKHRLDRTLAEAAQHKATEAVEVQSVQSAIRASCGAIQAFQDELELLIKTAPQSALSKTRKECLISARDALMRAYQEHHSMLGYNERNALNGARECAIDVIQMLDLKNAWEPEFLLLPENVLDEIERAMVALSLRHQQLLLGIETPERKAGAGIFLKSETTIRNHVLWADDDVEGVLQPLAGKLRRMAECEIDLAPNMETAINFLDQRKYSTILLDMIVPYRETSLSLNSGFRLAHRAVERGIKNVVFLTVIRKGEVLEEYSALLKKYPAVTFSYFDKLALLEPDVFRDLIACLERKHTDNSFTQNA